MNKYIKTTLKASAVIIGAGCITLSLPSKSMFNFQAHIVKASSQQDASESMQQDKKLDDCWEYNEKTKTLKVKSSLFQTAEYDDIFQDTDTWRRFDGISPWDSYSKEIEKIVVEEGTKSLLLAIFSGLPNLKEVSLPSTLTELPNYTFFNCSSLEKIEIPDSVTSIGYEAFFNCKNLKEITIGKEVSLINSNAFGYCSSLEKINLSPINKFFSVKDGILYDKQIKTLVLAPANAVEAVTIPETVEIIGALSFANCKNLEQIHIPYNVREISDGAFYNCTNLKSVTFDKNSKCQKISDFIALYGDVGYSYINKDVKKDSHLKDEIELYGAFENCQSLTAISFPDSLKTIGYYTLIDCASLNSIHFGSKFESAYNEYPDIEIKTPLFLYYRGLSNLTTVTVSSKNKKYSSDNGILFNKSKTELVWYPQNKKDTAYKIPKTVTKVGIRAFQNNKKLTKLNLSSVKIIEENAFYNCKKLSNVQWSKNLKLIKAKGFASCKKLKAFTSFGNNLTIGAYAFNNCKSLNSVLLKSGTRYIKNSAFYNCTFQKVTIPSSVIEIGTSAFGYYEENADQGARLENFTIYCKKYSPAYYYAKKNKFKYKFY